MFKKGFIKLVEKRSFNQIFKNYRNKKYINAAELYQNLHYFDILRNIVATYFLS